ncbi:MAG: putative Ig domain-containing protein [Bryobacteraceae bacterium]
MQIERPAHFRPRPAIVALLGLGLLAAGLHGQTFRLRTGGAGSTRHITQATQTTPIVITTQEQHGFADGDPIHVQFVRGNTAANGHWFADALTSTTVALYSNQALSTPSAGNGTFVTGSGTAGKTALYSLRSHPHRLLWADDNGLARITDPDGAGPQVAPAVQTGNPCISSDRSGCTDWDAALQALSVFVSPNGCDGMTPAQCPTEELRVSQNHYEVSFAIVPLIAAVAWNADQSQTRYLQAARYYLNNLDRVLVNGRFTACYQGFVHCGAGQDNDWASFVMADYAMVFELIRGQLTPAEITAFRQKILNGVENPGSFTNTLEKQPGEAFAVSGSKVVTFSGIDATAVYSPGDWIWLKMTPKMHRVSEGDLVSIVSDGAGVCNMTTTYWTGVKDSFLTVSGSTEASLNGVWYTESNAPRTTAPFGIGFLCPGVPAGTYNSASLQVIVDGNVSSGPVWAKIATVDSPTQVTMTANVTVSAFGGEGRHIQHFRAKPWTPASHGLMWFVSNHGQAPSILNRRGVAHLAGAIDDTQTAIGIDSAADFLDPAPFFILIDSEFLRVTSIDGNNLTVERGAFDTTPRPHNNNRMIIWSRFPTGGRDWTGDSLAAGDPRSNLALTKLYGYFIAAIALASDDPAAVTIAENAFNWWYDYMYPVIDSSWTGMSGGSSTTGYHGGRWMDFMVVWAETLHSFTAQPLDLFAGQKWLNAMYYPIYAGMPYNWLITPRFADAGSDEQTLENDDFKHAAVTASTIGGVTGQHFRYWLENTSNFLAFSQQAQTSTGKEVIPYYLLHRGGWPSASDYRTLPTYRYFTQVDSTVKKPLGLLFSRGSWTDPSATHLTVLGAAPAYDHWAGYPAPGGYKIARCAADPCTQGDARGRLLDDDANAGMGSAGTTNYVEVGAANNLKPGSIAGLVHDGQNPVWDRQYGSPTSVYTRIDTAGSYKTTVNVTAASRQVAHLKPAGQSADYVIAYDHVRTSSPQAIRTRLFYRIQKKTPVPTGSLAGDTFVYTDPMSNARMSSKILLGGTVTQGANTAYSIPLTLDGGTATEAEFLVLHRVSGSLSDTLPPVTLLTSDSNFRALQVDDPGTPLVVLFSKTSAAGASNYISASAVSTHAGQGRYLVGGLTPGTYEVKLNGSVILSGLSVDGNTETLEFNAPAGTVLVSQTGAVILAASVSEIPVSWTAGDPDPADRGFTAFCQDAACTVTASANTPWCAVTPASGPSPQAFSITLTPSGSSLAPGAYSCPIEVSSPVAANSPETVTVVLTVSAASGGPPQIFTSSLPGGQIGGSYTTELAGACSVTPCTWSIPVGTLPAGLTLNSSTGVISGVPIAAATSNFTVRLTDAASAFADKAFSISVSGDQPVSVNHLSGSFDLTLNTVATVVFNATGGSGNYTWALDDPATLPEGLEFDSGLISGAARRIGNFAILVRATDENNLLGELAVTITVRPPLSATLNVRSVSTGNNTASVVVSKPGLPADEPCQLIVRSSVDPQTPPAASDIVPAGVATRTLFVAGLSPATAYTLDAACGANGAIVGATTSNLSGSANLTWNGSPPPLLPVANVLLEHGPTAALGSNVSQSCSASCQVSLGSLPRGSVHYIRYTWRGSANQILAGPSQVTAVMIH